MQGVRTQLYTENHQINTTMAKCSLFTPEAINERRAEIKKAVRVLAKYDAMLEHLSDAIKDNRLTVLEREDGSIEIHLLIN